MFYDLDGAGPTLTNTPYTTRAALNSAPDPTWPVPCGATTGGRGLCDTATRTASSPTITTFTNGRSHLFFDQNGERINLEVCADSLPGQIVFAQLTRPGRTWDVVSQPASGTCATFYDLDGAGPTLTNTPYTTRVALNNAPDPTWPVPCGTTTGTRGLCDTATRTESSPNITTFTNGRSRLFFDQNGERINLEVCADSLPGQTVFAQLTRPGRTWDVVSQAASGTCVTFYDLDGAGPTLTNTPYITRAALNSTPDPTWPVPCGSTTGARGLCDTATRAESAPNVTTFTNGVSRLFFDQNGERINLEVCADSLPGQTVFAQLTRPGRTWDVVSQAASGTCVTFYDLDGAGPTLTNTPYTTRAALNSVPDPTWPVPCGATTGARGLCDTATRTN